MAFRKKNSAIMKFSPDILIIPECENEEKLKFGNLTPTPTDFCWYGDNIHKGIGIFSYSSYKFQVFENYNAKYRYVIPMKVKGKEDFNLFAIWAMDNKESPRARYIAQVWLAINYYQSKLNIPSILIGDFNSNKIWDEDHPRKYGNHSEVNDYLYTLDIHSLYHLQTEEKLGEEKNPTLYLHRNKTKPYHIDYCFASNNLLVEGFDFSIGKYEEWIKYSDHVPIFVDFKKGN